MEGYLASKELKPIAGATIHRYKVKEEKVDQESG